jgi:hypothetical protein
MGTTKAKATVCVDAAGYVRGIRYVLTPRLNGRRVTLTMSSEIFGIGESVTVDEPSGRVIEA